MIANITNVVEESKGKYIVTAEIVDKGVTLTRTFQGIVSKEGAENAVKGWANSLQLTPPAVGAVKLVEDPAPEPTAEELKEAEYNSKKAELSQLKQDLDLKLVTQAEYDAKVAEVKTVKEDKVKVK